MDEQAAAVGIADHNGWGIFVCVAARDGVPAVLDRRRVELIAPDLPSQPYHHETLELDPNDAEELVAKVKQSVASHAKESLSQLQFDISPAYQIVSIALREPPIAMLPETVAEVHSSRALTYTSDGMLYHEALCHAATELGVQIVLHTRGDEITRAAQLFGVDKEQVGMFLSEARRALGPPWRKEHRSAAAAAIIALSRHTQLDRLHS